jgi:hypothetical protein
MSDTIRQPVGLAAPAATAPVVVLLFVLSIIPPSYFFVADLRLSMTRALLLLAFVPLLFRLLTGAAGRLRGHDLFLMLFMVWMVVTLLYHHGLERLPYAMISVVELLGGYLVGRVLVRNATDFALVFRYVFWVLVALFPFVLIELLTDRNILQELSRKVLPTFVKGGSSYGRLGMFRVMAGFEHPILYGLFCAAVFGPVMAVLGRGKTARSALLAFLGFMTFASLSSAPLLALAIQLGLMAWAWVMGSRWWLLFGLVASAYVTVDLLSNRTPITILINYITFNPATAWTRVMTWQFGSAEMWRNPVFGIGLNDWERPYWLTGSVDNFWLLMGMRHGVLGVLVLICALALHLWRVMHSEGLAGRDALYRRNFVIALIALYVALCTVHIWGDTSSFIMFLIGAGTWFLDAASAAPAEASPVATPVATGQDQSPRYSRFPAKPRHRSDSAAMIDDSVDRDPETGYRLARRTAGFPAQVEEGGAAPRNLATRHAVQRRDPKGRSA